MIALGLALFVALLVSVHGLANLVQNLDSRTTFFSKKNYLTIGPIIIASASVAWAIAENRWPLRPRIIATLVTGLVLTLFIGAKTDLFIPIALMVAAVYYLWRRFRLISVALGLVAMVAVLSLYNIYFRSALPQHISLSSAVAQSGGWTQLITHDFVGDTFLSQQVLTIAVAEFGQSHPYLGTSGVKAIVVAPIPRGLFPNKPASPSAAFTRSFDPQFLASGSTIPPTAFGEMYIDFGIPGVAYRVLDPRCIVAGCI